MDITLLNTSPYHLPAASPCWTCPGWPSTCLSDRPHWSPVHCPRRRSSWSHCTPCRWISLVSGHDCPIPASMWNSVAVPPEDVPGRPDSFPSTMRKSWLGMWGSRKWGSSKRDIYHLHNCCCLSLISRYLARFNRFLSTFITSRWRWVYLLQLHVC